MKQLYLTVTLFGLVGVNLLNAAADAKAVDPAEIILGGLQATPTREHTRIPILGTIPLVLEPAAAKTAESATIRGDIDRAASAARAGAWERAGNHRHELYERETALEQFRSQSGLRSIELGGSTQAMRRVTDIGRVIEKLRADRPFESALVAKTLEKRATRGYLNWRKANPEKPLYLYTQPAATVGEPAVAIEDLIRLG